MSDAVVQVPPDSTGKMLDSESVVVGANTVYRQRFELSGAAAAAIASVLNGAPAGTEYALVTRNIPSGTQPVSLAALPALTAGAASVGTVRNDDTLQALTGTTTTAASGAAITLTIAAAGAGLFNYLSWLQIVAYSAAARTGAATPWLVTTTGISGLPVFTFSTGAAIGTNEVQERIFDNPLKGTAANTAMTVVCPVATGVIWRVNAGYFTAA